MRNSCLYILVCGCILAGCSHKQINTIVAHPMERCDTTQLEYYEFTFSEELLDTTLSVTLTYPEDSRHRLVPWGGGNRVRVGYSYAAADTVYFVMACSQDIRNEEGDVFTFRRKFKPSLRILMARSHDNISAAVTAIHNNIASLGWEE